MGYFCFRFMKYLKSKYRGHKAEISSRKLTRECRFFASHTQVNEAYLLQGLHTRGYIEPSAADTYLLRYDKAIS